MHLIPNWFRSSSSQMHVLLNFAKFTWKHLCGSHFLTALRVSMLEISLKKDSGTGIFLWIFCNFSKNLLYKTSPDDWSCWLLRYNQSFIHWSHFVFFFKQKMKTSLLFAIVYSKVNIDIVTTISLGQ